MIRIRAAVERHSPQALIRQAVFHQTLLLQAFLGLLVQLEDLKA
jgi:hypothetical protein